MPPTEVPGVEEQLSSDGCVIITTETLPPDEVATIGDDGISVITTTVVEAEATTTANQEVVETMVVTLEGPPAGGVGAPQPSVVTMTMTVSAAPHPPAGGPSHPPAEPSVVTVTVGDSTGVVTLPAPPKATEDSAEKPVEGVEQNTNAPPKATDGPGRGPAAGRPGRPGAGGAEECPEAVTVTVTEAAVTVTVTKDGNVDVTETPTETLVDIVDPTPEATPPALGTPLLPPAGTTLTTQIGAGPTDAPVEIPDQLNVDDKQPAAPAPDAAAPKGGLFGSLFGN
jgi:hypothetical protein